MLETIKKHGHTTHGLTYNPIYSTWVNMLNRCTNINNSSFSYYGGDGIAICDRWKDVANFIEDIYPSYQEGLSIDRIDVNGNYEPSNCRWATKSVQQRNTRVLQRNNKSGYRGVHFSKKYNKWIAKIRIMNIPKHIGTFNTALEAAKAYDAYVIENNLEHAINRVANIPIQ